MNLEEAKERGIKVKRPLFCAVEVPPKSAPGTWQSATTILGYYEIHKFDGRDAFFLHVPGSYRMTEFGTVEDAETAAERDYEARILAALE